MACGTTDGVDVKSSTGLDVDVGSPPAGGVPVFGWGTSWEASSLVEARIVLLCV
jgi:hypothetical protein